ncbi:MAG: hypothetical protein EPGJADBJ_00078 [Saprospiraceae bacterium]|nr:hypothetical protein [Saprospiraceae bacterium]
MIDLLYSDTYPIVSNLLQVDWDFERSVPSDLHGVHPYPARFIPEIPRAILKNLPRPGESLIFDPFCGSGVTLTEAQRAGYPSLGVDINPIACLISRVKTDPLPTNFQSTAEQIVRVANFASGKTNIPEIPNLDHWFKKDIQEAVTRLLTQISTVQELPLQDALRFCLSAILVKISNQDSDTRYASVNKKMTCSDVFSQYLLTVEKLVKAKQSQITHVPATVLQANSLHLTDADVPGKIGLVITSPPYPNAYEYWLYHKYRMWWLGFDPIAVKNQEIGARAHYFKKNHQTAEDFVAQMRQLFSFLGKNVLQSGFAVFVIGRSKIHGKIIENEKIIETAGQSYGFRLVQTIPRIINPLRKSFNLSHARIQQEYIVILEKNR